MGGEVAETVFVVKSNIIRVEMEPKGEFPIEPMLIYSSGFHHQVTSIDI